MSLNPEADPGYPIGACGLCGGGACTPYAFTFQTFCI